MRSKSNLLSSSCFCERDDRMEAGREKQCLGGSLSKCCQICWNARPQLSAPSSHQGNPITAYCSLDEPLSTPVIFGHIFFHPRPRSRWRPGQGDWGSDWRVGRVRGCLPQRWASVIRTAQGWKDNRQNNVLFKDGSQPLFLKVARPEEAGQNTGEQGRHAQVFIFRDGLPSNFHKIPNPNIECQVCTI